ncbi:restriction endonuclease subunit S [Allopusillimonas ginsengisoli]|nr:restriction endonuclease subunit S [Allopusillimonas ginsengisoli]
MSFPKYLAYKESGESRVGPIPTHWSLVPCRSFVTECVEKNTSGAITEYLSLMANIGIIRYEDKGDIGNKKPDDLSKCKIVRRGNLVINSMNYGIGSYGLSALNGVCSSVYIVLNPIAKVVSERFALRVFEEKEFQSWAQSFGNGILAHRSAIGWDDLKNIKIALPPLSEQASISAFLDHETAKIDALIEEQQRLIELLKEKRQAVISQAVTKGLDPSVPMKDSGVEWLGEVPAHWTVCKLSFRYSVELGKMLDEKNISGKYLLPYLRNQDVQWGTINSEDLPTMDIHPKEFDRYTVKHGDLLVCEGGDVGRAALWQREENAVGYQKALHRLRPKAAGTDTAPFLFFSLMAAKENGVFEESDTKATISHLPAEKFRQYKFAFPPLVEQVKIVVSLNQKLHRANTTINTAIESTSLLKERRSALISAAVTGKIDVRGWQPANPPSQELNQESKPCLEGL